MSLVRFAAAVTVLTAVTSATKNASAQSVAFSGGASVVSLPAPIPLFVNPVNPVVSAVDSVGADSSGLRSAAFLAYRARLANRSRRARLLRRQRYLAARNANPGYTLPPDTARYSFLSVNQDGYITGVDLENRLRRQLGR